jgi:hypothetical protein
VGQEHGRTIPLADFSIRPWHPARDARNPVLGGVTFLAETVSGSNPPVVPAADIAHWDLSLGATADVVARCMPRVPLDRRASRRDKGTKEGTMTHSHLVSRRTALKVGAGAATIPLVHIHTARAANQKTFIMGYDPVGPTCHLGQYAALVKGFFAEIPPALDQDRRRGLRG